MARGKRGLFLIPKNSKNNNNKTFSLRVSVPEMDTYLKTEVRADALYLQAILI